MPRASGPRKVASHAAIRALPCFAESVFFQGGGGGGEGEGAGLRREAGLEPRDAGVFHQAHEAGLGQEGRALRVEAGIPLGEGESAVPGDGLARLQMGVAEGFGAKAFDRVAVEVPG